MKRIISLYLSLSVLFISSPAAADVFVKGYFRKDRTYINSHYRSNSDGFFYNNWSTKGNVNPYTGRAGTKTLKNSASSILYGSYRPMKSYAISLYDLVELYERNIIPYQTHLDQDLDQTIDNYDLEQTIDAARQQYEGYKSENVIYDLDNNVQDQYEKEAAELEEEIQKSIDELREIGENYDPAFPPVEEYIFDPNGAVKADDYYMEDNSDWE